MKDRGRAFEGKIITSVPPRRKLLAGAVPSDEWTESGIWGTQQTETPDGEGEEAEMAVAHSGDDETLKLRARVQELETDAKLSAVEERLDQKITTLGSELRIAIQEMKTEVVRQVGTVATEVGKMEVRQQNQDWKQNLIIGAILTTFLATFAIPFFKKDSPPAPPVVIQIPQQVGLPPQAPATN